MNNEQTVELTKEELEAKITESKIITCDLYRTIDILKSQQVQTEQQLNQQLQLLAQYEQKLNPGNQ